MPHHLSLARRSTVGDQLRGPMIVPGKQAVRRNALDVLDRAGGSRVGFEQQLPQVLVVMAAQPVSQQPKSLAVPVMPFVEE